MLTFQHTSNVRLGRKLPSITERAKTATGLFETYFPETLFEKTDLINFNRQ